MSTPLENRTHTFSVYSRLRGLCPTMSYKVENRSGVDLRIVVAVNRTLLRWAAARGDSWQNLLHRNWSHTRLRDMHISIVGDTISVHRPNSFLLRNMQEALWQRASCITGDAINRTAHAIARRRSVEGAETTLSTTVVCLRSVSAAHPIAPQRRIYETELILSPSSPLVLASARRDTARKPLVMLFSCEAGLPISSSCDPGGLFAQTTLLATWLASQAHRTFTLPSAAVVPGRSFSEAVQGEGASRGTSPQGVYVASCYPLVSPKNLQELSVLLSAPHADLESMLLRARGLLYLAYASRHTELIVSLDPCVFERLEGGALQNFTVVVGAFKQLLVTEFAGVFRRVSFTCGGLTVQGALFRALIDYDGPSYQSYAALVNSRGWAHALQSRLLDETRSSELAAFCSQHGCSVRLFQPNYLDQLGSVVPCTPSNEYMPTCILAFSDPYVTRDINNILVNSNLMGSFWEQCNFSDPSYYLHNLFESADRFSLIEANNLRLLTSPETQLSLLVAPTQPFNESQMEYGQISLFAILAEALMHIYLQGHREVSVQLPVSCSVQTRQALLTTLVTVIHEHFAGAFRTFQVAGQEVLPRPATLDAVISEAMPKGASPQLANYLHLFAEHCIAGSPVHQLNRLRQLRRDYLALFDESQHDCQLAFLQEQGRMLQPLLQPFYRKAAQAELKKLLPKMPSLYLLTLAQLKEMIATVRAEQALAVSVQEALSDLSNICGQPVKVSLKWEADRSTPFLLEQEGSRCQFLPRHKRYSCGELTELSNLLQTLSRRQALFQHFFSEWLGEAAPRYFIDSQSIEFSGRLLLDAKKNLLLWGLQQWHSKSACRLDFVEAAALLRAICPDGSQPFCEAAVLKSLCAYWGITGVDSLKVFFEQRTSLQWQGLAQRASLVFPATSVPPATPEQIDAVYTQDEAGLGYLDATAFLRLAQEAAPREAAEALAGISVFLGRNGVLIEGGNPDACRTTWAAHAEHSVYFGKGHLRLFVTSFSLWAYSLTHARHLGVSSAAIKRSVNRLIAYADDWEDHCPNGNAGRMLEVWGALSGADLLTYLWQAFLEEAINEAFQKAVASFSRGSTRERLLAAESSTYAAAKAYLRQDLAKAAPLLDPHVCESLPKDSLFHCLDKIGLLSYLKATQHYLLPHLSTSRYLESFASYVHSELASYQDCDQLSETELLRLLRIPKSAPLWHPELGWHSTALAKAVDFALPAALVRAGCCKRI